MSDARLRELERRWKETGSPDDEAAYLLERVRVGDLTRERLELAAYCGHEAAIGSDAQELPPTTSLDWINGLSDHGHQASCMAALIVVRLATQTYSPAPETLLKAVNALESWVKNPTEPYRPVLDGEDVVRATFLDPAIEPRESALRRCAVHAALSIIDPFFLESKPTPPSDLPMTQAQHAILALGEVTDISLLQAAIARGLVEWALT